MDSANRSRSLADSSHITIFRFHDGRGHVRSDSKAGPFFSFPLLPCECPPCALSPKLPSFLLLPNGLPKLHLILRHAPSVLRRR